MHGVYSSLTPHLPVMIVLFGIQDDFPLERNIFQNFCGQKIENNFFKWKHKIINNYNTF